MKCMRISLISGFAMIFLGTNAFATTSSQILVMSNQLYQIAKDLTTGLFPTSVLLIAIGAHSLIKALNTGHPGGLSTVHANSATSGLLRLEQLIMESGVAPVPEAIVEAVNVLVFIEKSNKGRVVSSILELKGYDKKTGYQYS